MVAEQPRLWLRWFLSPCERRRAPALSRGRTPEQLERLNRWRRVVCGAQRLRRLRRLWAALGHHLKEIKQRGRE